MLVDQLNLDSLAIEANLAHSVKDSNGRSYNRTQYLAQRFTQIQQWADYLDKLRTGATVVPMHQRVCLINIRQVDSLVFDRQAVCVTHPCRKRRLTSADSIEFIVIALFVEANGGL